MNNKIQQRTYWLQNNATLARSLVMDSSWRKLDKESLAMITSTGQAEKLDSSSYFSSIEVSKRESFVDRMLYFGALTDKFKKNGIFDRAAVYFDKIDDNLEGVVTSKLVLAELLISSEVEMDALAMFWNSQDLGIREEKTLKLLALKAKVLDILLAEDFEDVSNTLLVELDSKEYPRYRIEPFIQNDTASYLKFCFILMLLPVVLFGFLYAVRDID